jgi:hypothetical protein
VPSIPSFDDYVSSLGRLTAHVDPVAASGEAAEIKEAAGSLAALDEISIESLTGWVADHPAWVNVLGLAVGLSQEKLLNALKDRLGTLADGLRSLGSGQVTWWPCLSRTSIL